MKCYQKARRDPSWERISKAGRPIDRTALERLRALAGPVSPPPTRKNNSDRGYLPWSSTRTAARHPGRPRNTR